MPTAEDRIRAASEKMAAVFDSANAETKRRLEAAIQDAENRILALLARIGDEDTEGRRAALAQAMEIRSQLRVAFEVFYKAAAETTEKWTRAAESGARALAAVGLPAEFSTVDIRIIEQLERAAYDDLERLGDDIVAQVGDEIYKGALAARPLQDTIKAVRNIVTGLEDRAGKPMSSHAATIAHDHLMKLQRGALTSKALDLGVTKYMLVGSVIETSREWCQEHAGNIYTLQEIEAFDSQDWAGKDPNSPCLIAAGGYNCRHHWQPIPDSLAKVLGADAGEGD